jgi:hypothetical protein
MGMNLFQVVQEFHPKDPGVVFLIDLRLDMKNHRV